MFAITDWYGYESITCC